MKILARVLAKLTGRQVGASVLAELEEQLLLADLGVKVTNKIMAELHGPNIKEQLLQQLVAILQPCEQPLVITDHQPYVIMLVGVNGSGKTTTLAKLAASLQSQGKHVMIAAGDTFRAAAIEQLQSWGQRCKIPVIAQQLGADSAAVALDALQAARARGMDVLMIDTAGRLHTQTNLMAELQKIIRVLQKVDVSAPHEVLLVLDATSGQNALAQAQHFHKLVPVTGLCLTKLDGTAKGGIIFAIADALRLPLRYLGVGEGLADLRVFVAQEFVKALL